jgi:hypothetical protein
MEQASLYFSLLNKHIMFHFTLFELYATICFCAYFEVYRLKGKPLWFRFLGAFVAFVIFSFDLEEIIYNKIYK